MSRPPDPSRDDVPEARPWTKADDDLLRSALMTLRDDVERLAPMDPAEVRARYGPGRRRRNIAAWLAAAAAVVVAAIGLSQLGQDRPGGLAPAVPDGSSVSTAPTAPTPSPTPSQDETSADETNEASPTPGTTITPCGAVVGELDATGVNAAQRAKADQLLTAALACDAGTLIDIATEDQSELSFGVTTPEEVFAIPPTEEERYRVLSVLLSLPPRVEDGFARWPAEPESAADWQTLVDAGILTERDAVLIQQSGAGYTGFRVVVDGGGRMTAFLGGD